MKSQFGFTLPEFLGVLAIVAIIISAMIWNFQASKVKMRNEQRKANARSIVYSVQSYHQDFGVYPRSENGKILGCGQPDHLIVCEYGKDKLIDLRNPNGNPYLNPIPYDPSDGQGVSYNYISSGAEFQVYAHLEQNDDPEYSTLVESFGLKCGQKVCNYGISYRAGPVKEQLKVGN